MADELTEEQLQALEAYLESHRQSDWEDIPGHAYAEDVPALIAALREAREQLKRQANNSSPSGV